MADQPKVFDNPMSPDFFVDDAMAFSMMDNIVRITFTSNKHTQPPPGEPVRVVVGRMVLSVAAAQRLALGLNDYLTTIGANPSESIKAGETVQ